MSRSTRAPLERLTSASTSPLMKWTTLSASMLLYGSPQREIGMCSMNLSPCSAQVVGRFLEVRRRDLAVEERDLDPLRRAAPRVPLGRGLLRRDRFERATDADRAGDRRPFRHVQFDVLLAGAAQERLHVREAHAGLDLVEVFLCDRL